MNRGSAIYSCMLDASKAFDRLRYDKLFQLLIKQDFPPIVIRALLDMYTRQEAWTGWNNHYSEYFGVHNGIRQGGIISPLLYTVYADELIELEGIGCHIGSKYYVVICFLSSYQCINTCLALQMNMWNVSVKWSKWMLEV